MNQIEQTINQLQERKGDWVEIAQRADVSYSWITKFAQGKIPNPGILTLNKLSQILKQAA
jgi:transcriptional regulator with XRE-family HTH domain